MRGELFRRVVPSNISFVDTGWVPRCPQAMFLGRKRIDDIRTKIQVVESERTGGKVRQRVLRHVGTARGPAETEALEGVARLIMEELRAARAGAQPMFSIRETG